jgi:hypothetical protein
MLRWADEAIEELDASCGAFFNKDNFGEVREFDAKTNLITLKIVLTGAIPSAVRRKIAEALNSIRHSFDQSLFAACWAITGSKPKQSIYFPWATDPIDLQKRLDPSTRIKPGKTAKSPSIPPDLWPILSSFEPYGRGNSYPGGDDTIRTLAQISSERKHTIRLSCGVNVDGFQPGSYSSKGRGSLSIFAPRWDPVKNEIKISEFSPNVQTDYKYQLYGYIALDEPAMKGANVIEALGVFKAKAQSVLEGLEGEVRRITGKP